MSDITCITLAQTIPSKLVGSCCHQNCSITVRQRWLLLSQTIFLV